MSHTTRRYTHLLAGGRREYRPARQSCRVDIRVKARKMPGGGDRPGSADRVKARVFPSLSGPEILQNTGSSRSHFYNRLAKSSNGLHASLNWWSLIWTILCGPTGEPSIHLARILSITISAITTIMHHHLIHHHLHYHQHVSASFCNPCMCHTNECFPDAKGVIISIILLRHIIDLEVLHTGAK